MRFGGIFDFDLKRERLEEVVLELENPDVWQDHDRALALGQERATLEHIVLTLDKLRQQLEDMDTLVTMSKEENDEDTFQALLQDMKSIDAQLQQLEFHRMFSGEMDAHSAYVDIQSGSGGTEAQDWAEMLLRMYLRWSDQHGFKTNLIEASPGEVAGIKSATIHIVGEYAYGWLKHETGVHRLVRKSPFDSGNRRHTSFASLFVSPELDDDIAIEVNPADLRIDTYRAQGAGGQHVNKTDSAVRITHNPSGIVVQCQSDRSQHKNKDYAMKQLKAKLYELALQEKQAEQQVAEGQKMSIGWGSQIRSYVLDASRIKDLRTGVETSNTQAVLDGGIDLFLTESLKQGICDSTSHE